MHGAFALALVSAPSGQGMAVRESAAISMNLIETRIIDASEDADDQASDAANAEVDQQQGAQKDSAPSPDQKKKETVEDKQEKRAPGKAANKPKTEPKQQKKTTQPAKAQRKGGAQSRSASEKKTSSSGAVSASRGAVNSYLGRVRARVASRRPRNVRGRGTAVVSFGISRSGSVRYVRLSRSSGNRSLDSAALGAVRRAAPFPRPPTGMSLRQLSFRIPFHFR